MPASVSLAAPHEYLSALRLLFPDVVEPPRGGAESAALLVSHDTAGRVCAVALAQALPGALGLVHPPRGESPEHVDALAAATCAWLRDRSVKVCQAFATSEELSRMAALESRGFQRVTELVSLRIALGEEPVVSPVVFTPEQPPFTPAFRTTLLAIDRDTLDCPELNGSRSDEELLTSIAEPSPDMHWYIAQKAGSPVGLVMLMPGAIAGELELAYLGVVPTARGRGWGANCSPARGRWPHELAPAQ